MALRRIAGGFFFVLLQEGAKMDEERVFESIIKHMWENSHLSNLGYDSMSEEMKLTFNKLVGKPIGDRNT